MVGKGPAEGVEYQVEPEVELLAEVVAGLEDVLRRQLDEVRVLTRGELPDHGSGYVGDAPWAVEGESGLLQREPVHVAVDESFSTDGTGQPHSLDPFAPASTPGQINVVNS
jgi:hypothetical protein